MKLSEAFKAWLPRAYRQPTTHYTEANMEAAFLAGAEAAVQAAFWRAEANSSVEEARFPSRAKQKGGGA